MHDNGGPCFGKERIKANFPDFCSRAKRRMHTAYPNQPAVQSSPPATLWNDFVPFLGPSFGQASSDRHAGKPLI